MPTSPKRKSQFTFAAAASLGLAIVLWGLSPSLDKGPAAGTIAPEFELTDLAGESARLSDYRGKIVLVDFWATWCVSCEQEVPKLRALHEKFGQDGFALLAASVDEGGPEIVARFAAEFKLPYRVLFADRGTVQDYRIFGLPTKYLIDRDGRVYKRYLMDTTAAEIEADIRALVNRRNS